MISTDFSGTVNGWLRALGCTPVEENDPNAKWHVHIDYPVKTPNVMHVVIPKDGPEGLVVASGFPVGHEHLKAFEERDDDGKEEFIHGLRLTMNTLETDFKWEGVTGPLDCPKLIQISALRFPDGLTQDALARTIGAVFKTQLSTVWFFQHHLGSGGSGPGGRFDFKRLGL